MNVRGIRRRVAAGCLVAGSLIALGAAPTSATSGVVLTIDPNKDLVDNQHATFYGSGLKTDYSYETKECGTQGTDGCNSETGVASTDSRGNFTADVVVRRFVTNPGAATIDCASAPRRCAVFVRDQSTLESQGTALTFKAPK